MHWFIDPIRDHYADFEGRVTRQTFWLYTVIYMVLSSIINTFSKAFEMDFISFVFGVALFVPSIAIATRRLHDTSRSGWWQLLWIIPVIGWLILLIFLVQDSTPGDNQYGPNPKAPAAPNVPVQTPTPMQ